MSDRTWSSTRAAQVAPVIAIAANGAEWIAAHASQASVVHVLFQSVALAESVIALLVRRRKPRGSLIGILVVYTLVELDAVLLPGVLLALATTARRGTLRAVALATAAAAAATAWVTTAGARSPAGLAGSIPAHITAVAVAAGVGLLARRRVRRRARR